MANVDYFGNVIRVTAAGSMTFENAEIISARVWSANTTANLIVVSLDSAGAELARFSTNVNTALMSDLIMEGRYNGGLTFNTVTACTAYFTVA